MPPSSRADMRLPLTTFCTPNPALLHRPAQLPASRSPSSRRILKCDATPSSPSPDQTTDPYDAVIIGAGLGGLCTAALLSSYGRRVAVLESHTAVGGAAHSFRRRVAGGSVKFESGPHLFSGLTGASGNPLRHVIAATGAQVQVTGYDRWGVFLEGVFTSTSVRAGEPFLAALVDAHGGPRAAQDLQALLAALAVPGELATSLPPALLRADDGLGSARMILSHLAAMPRLWPLLPQASQLSQPFGPMLDAVVDDKFVTQFMNLLCFLLAGVDASRIPLAEVAFMMSEWVPAPGAGMVPGAPLLHHPVGGASAVAHALAEVVRRDGRSCVRTAAHVESVVVDGAGKAVGVQLRSREVVRARKVVCNASAQAVSSLLPDDWKSSPVVEAEASREMCDSFMHLHVALRLTEDIKRAMPRVGGEMTALLPNYVSVEDWGRGLDDRDNVVLISVPSVVDPSVCPEGYCVLHAYTPATEPYAPWAALREGTPEYEEYKQERSGVLWRAVNNLFGVDVRQHAEVALVGTPRTQERFLNRKCGSYGPKVDARRGGLVLPFPSQSGLPEGMMCVGDGVFPGVGVPAVAGSAWLVANSMVDLREQREMLRRIDL